MKQIVPILLLLLPVCGFSQQRTIDSLQRLLPTATTDSARYWITFNIGYYYEYTDYDSALHYIDQALLLAQKNGKKINEASVLSDKGFILSRLQRIPESYQATTTALQIAEDPRNELSFWNKSNPDVKGKDVRLKVLARIHDGLGLFLQNASRADEAALHFKKAINLFTLLGDSTNVASANGNLATVYFKDLNKPDSALLLAKTAASFFLRQNDERVLGFFYTGIGYIYLIKHNDSLGLAYEYQAIPIHKKYNSSGSLTTTYRNLSTFYIQKKNKDSALYYARLAAKINMPESPMDVGDDFENLAKSYELNNKPDSAYKYHRLALATYDSLYRNRIKGLTGFQQLSFEQQQQLQQLEAQKTAAQNTYRIYGLLVGLGIIGLIGFFLYRNNQQQRKANQRLQKQKQETEEQKHKAESALQELKSAQAQLIQSEKMASLGELTAGIAHEIQNPLNFVNNFSEVSTELVDELKGERSKVNGERDEELETAILNDLSQNLVKINHHGKRADAIVKGMLEHSRTTKGEKQVTDLNALADEYLRLSYHGLRAKDKDFNATIETDFDETIGKIEVVAQDIGRVLLNLYNNAFHAVNERRKSAGEGFKPIVQIQTKKVNSKVEVVVKDNGDGIPENVINKIFQPFFTTKPTGQGTGLGLSLSYDIIKAHGGEIKVQSKEGEGSTFIIQL
jgi:signal transduction histidine kinase